MNKIERTGQRPLEFEGDKLAEATTKNHAGKERNRWHEITIWKTKSGKYVAAIAYKTRWEGEADYDDAVVFDSTDQVSTLLEEYIFPNVGTIGFPASPTYTERQGRLMSELEQAFRHAAGQVIGQLGVSEKV